MQRAPSPPRIGERSSRAAETAFGQKKSSPPGHASQEFSSSPELFVDGPFAMPPPPPLPPVQGGVIKALLTTSMTNSKQRNGSSPMQIQTTSIANRIPSCYPFQVAYAKKSFWKVLSSEAKDAFQFCRGRYSFHCHEQLKHRPTNAVGSQARDRPAALLRSAQPLVGVTGEKSEADENLLRACIRLNPRYPRLQVRGCKCAVVFSSD